MYRIVNNKTNETNEPTAWPLLAFSSCGTFEPRCQVVCWSLSPCNWWRIGARRCIVSVGASFSSVSSIKRTSNTQRWQAGICSALWWSIWWCAGNCTSGPKGQNIHRAGRIESVRVHSESQDDIARPYYGGRHSTWAPGQGTHILRSRTAKHWGQLSFERGNCAPRHCDWDTNLLAATPIIWLFRAVARHHTQ